MKATAASVRDFAAALPETEEREHMGSASFRVAGKIFAQLNRDETLALVKLPVAEQAARVRVEPLRFSLPEHWSQYGWTLVRIAASDAAELGALIERSWCAVAPQKLTTAKAAVAADYLPAQQSDGFAEPPR